MSEAFDIRIQRVAEEHLRACQDALYEGEESSPASAPFCGCDTCIVREVLGVVWTELVREAQLESDPDAHNLSQAELERRYATVLPPLIEMYVGHDWTWRREGERWVRAYRTVPSLDYELKSDPDGIAADN